MAEYWTDVILDDCRTIQKAYIKKYERKAEGIGKDKKVKENDSSTTEQPNSIAFI